METAFSSRPPRRIAAGENRNDREEMVGGPAGKGDGATSGGEKTKKNGRKEGEKEDGAQGVKDSRRCGAFRPPMEAEREGENQARRDGGEVICYARLFHVLVFVFVRYKVGVHIHRRLVRGGHETKCGIVCKNFKPFEGRSRSDRKLLPPNSDVREDSISNQSKAVFTALTSPVPYAGHRKGISNYLLAEGPHRRRAKTLENRSGDCPRVSESYGGAESQTSRSKIHGKIEVERGRPFCREAARLKVVGHAITPPLVNTYTRERVHRWMNSGVEACR